MTLSDSQDDAGVQLTSCGGAGVQGPGEQGVQETGAEGEAGQARQTESQQAERSPAWHGRIHVQ